MACRKEQRNQLLHEDDLLLFRKRKQQGSRRLLCGDGACHCHGGDLPRLFKRQLSGAWTGKSGAWILQAGQDRPAPKPAFREQYSGSGGSEFLYGQLLCSQTGGLCAGGTAKRGPGACLHRRGWRIPDAEGCGEGAGRPEIQLSEAMDRVLPSGGRI